MLSFFYKYANEYVDRPMHSHARGLLNRYVNGQVHGYARRHADACTGMGTNVFMDICGSYVCGYLCQRVWSVEFPLHVDVQTVQMLCGDIWAASAH